VEAHSALTTARIQMEQFYQDNRTYVGATCPAATTYFSYACTLAANTFTITASSAANQGLGAAGSYVYTINQSNAKTTTAFPGEKPSTTTWISK
ncbi:MAG: pilus assembly protein PilE, partial [Gallionellales bacterium CG_4_8_14_3_um_filter_54_18]